MSAYTEPPRDRGPIEAPPLDKAFLDVPDEDNEAIFDARKTFLITVASAAVFIAIILLFVL